MKFRRSQPSIYIKYLPNPVPPRDYSVLPPENQEEAMFFWEFLDKFKEDFEKRGHPLQYRQLIDLLKDGPIWDLKIFSAEVLEASKHLRKYTLDSVLRREIFEIIIKNMKSTEYVGESAQSLISLLLSIPLTSSDIQEIISIFEQESKSFSYNIDYIIIKLKSKLKENEV